MKASEDQVGGSHYKGMAIQPAEFIHKNGIGFLEGNVIKYVCRHNEKGGRADLLKARHYLDLMLEWAYPELPANVPELPIETPAPGPVTVFPYAYEVPVCVHGRTVCKVCKFP